MGEMDDGLTRFTQGVLYVGFGGRDIFGGFGRIDSYGHRTMSYVLFARNAICWDGQIASAIWHFT